MSTFDKYWGDPKKHEKRIAHWLPFIRRSAEQIGGGRPFRYFTLCGRTMIDVFLLIREKILTQEPATGAIQSVWYCERRGQDYTEIKDLIAREDAGFRGYLEKIVLFRDDEFTTGYDTLRSIAMALSDDEKLANSERGDRLREKRLHLLFASSFPYDYLNLDYCSDFYDPPNVWDIRNSIKRMLRWQREQSIGGVFIDEFTASITCRLDEKFPGEEGQHLVDLVESNRALSREYNAEFEKHCATETARWIDDDPPVFFLSSWPKDIGALASAEGWEMETLDYVYYERVYAKGEYLMVCLVARFVRSSHPNYLPSAIAALDPARRTIIHEPEPASEKRRELIEDLRGIAELRNERARSVGLKDVLPDPA